ncbi:MAG: cob(I)yrinic acid a,c-diamide adenosyltransferase [Synergistaceae bacterium]|jgi:cob(I)alamin adenosyltransferase|nr:cob(I)yrinic acid a,c-diamide adenosyltransferase [Synergistaceae bacterium]
MVYDSKKDAYTRGCVQVYTGNGKGKTTASMGLAIRALGAGFSVLFAQFLKVGSYSEMEILGHLDNLTCKQYGTGKFIMRSPTEEDRAAAAEGLRDAVEEMESGRWDLVILDEVNVAFNLGLLSEDDLLSAAAKRPDMVELVFTGRGAPRKLIEMADLVTEMQEIKHYYKAGIPARKGIES